MFAVSEKELAGILTSIKGKLQKMDFESNGIPLPLEPSCRPEPPDDHRNIRGMRDGGPMRNFSRDGS